MTKLKQRFFARTAIGFIAVVCLLVFSSWGMWGHQHINKAAVFALPPEMSGFFYNHIDFITEESVVPDLRKYTIKDKEESPRHYIDLELYNKPIDSLPLTPKEAHAIYADSILQKNGHLPWMIQEVMDKLTNSMKQGRKTEILFLAGDLGHYLGDAHMPLHTTVNHDGQATDQRGIHSFWEAQLPEVFGESYNLYTGEAHYINDIPKETWRIMKNSNALVDTLLSIELKLKKSTPVEKMYKMDSTGKMMKNKFGQPVHTNEYAKLYHDALKGMVEQQMRLAIMATANFWYTAWVNAGKPDLVALDSPALTNRNKENYKADVADWKKGKLTNLKIDIEY